MTAYHYPTGIQPASLRAGNSPYARVYGWKVGVILACYLTAAVATNGHVDPNATRTSRFCRGFPASVVRDGRPVAVWDHAGIPVFPSPAPPEQEERRDHEEKEY